MIPLLIAILSGIGFLVAYHTYGRWLGRKIFRLSAETVCPLLRNDTTSDPRSCTAPMKIDPNTTQSSAGSQPHITAMAGPTIGPVPAMLVK